ncbi:Npun_F5749 family FMN-dependent PPOX-type flavoprotein [Sodalinema gerasimenkoae]|uniref:Npun_F5749 family FMN-dependent PPOX-type flavoprotein n=1 Tax=Sodalinema gerasimenkoae TaxID=2862348 RepID=UPI0013588FEE|nr:Npun_F5749 family FMN-dependent PPOX-type flavoprotein [Sodalinema gerasimenkoae]
MSLAPWRTHLAAALHLNRSLIYARYLQLATVRPDGTPANRTVVFRGFAEGDRLQIITDRRSAKMQEIADNCQAEACWYFPKTREQFRLGGSLISVSAASDDEELQRLRSHLWQQISDNARSSFAWPEPGGDRTPLEAFQVSPPNPKTPLESFALLLLEPIRVDWLQLRGNPQNRHLYQRNNDGSWSQQELNP